MWPERGKKCRFAALGRFAKKLQLPRNDSSGYMWVSQLKRVVLRNRALHTAAPPPLAGLAPPLPMPLPLRPPGAPAPPAGLAPPLPLLPNLPGGLPSLPGLPSLGGLVPNFPGQLCNILGILCTVKRET